jgi:hypothetical protein
MDRFTDTADNMPEKKIMPTKGGQASCLYSAIFIACLPKTSERMVLRSARHPF